MLETDRIGAAIVALTIAAMLVLTLRQAWLTFHWARGNALMRAMRGD